MVMESLVSHCLKSMEKIKKCLILLIIIGGLFILNNSAFSHPGNTASDGCHYCRTNCSSWGVAWNQRHCHGGGSYSPPSYDYPSYDYPSYTPSIPNCPSMSYYDSLSDSCKCYSGYVASGGSCISTGQYCRDLLGWSARYNILTDKCECSYGYVLSGGSCIDGDTLCHQQYGFNSDYDSLTEKCKCSYGYVFDSNNQCVSEDDYCQDLYGYHSEYNILTDRCVCDDGYEFKNNECVEITPIIYSFYPTVAEAGESVNVSGNNFGDYKGDIILNTLSFGTLGKISSWNIKSWSDDKIRFTVPEDKEPDRYYIRVRPSSLFSSKEAVSRNKLEISEPEENQPFIYNPILPKKEITISPQPTPKSEPSPEPKPIEEYQPQPEPQFPQKQEEPQPQKEPKFFTEDNSTKNEESFPPEEEQESQETEQQGQQYELDEIKTSDNNIDSKTKQEKKGILNYASGLLASIYNATKNFFSTAFSWF